MIRGIRAKAVFILKYSWTEVTSSKSADQVKLCIQNLLNELNPPSKKSGYSKNVARSETLLKQAFLQHFEVFIDYRVRSCLRTKWYLLWNTHVIILLSGGSSLSSLKIEQRISIEYSDWSEIAVSMPLVLSSGIRSSKTVHQESLH
jgi:hypothetical protein